MSTTEPTTDRVVVEVSDGIAELRLTRGDGGNAIDRRWTQALAAAIDAIEDALAAPGGREAVRAVLLTAEGKAFTVGGDIAHFHANRERLDEELEAMVSEYDASVVRLAELPVPVVCAVQGAAAGGGLGLAWASDIVLCSPEAKFATGFAKLGLSGDGGCSWFLPRLVGLRRALELMLEARVIGAEEALEWGVVNAVVPAEDLAATARERARAFADGPTIALGRMRALVRGSADVPLAEHMLREVENMAVCGKTEDAREGITAFTERRPAEFRAR